MLLAIDIGNTNVVLGVFKDDKQLQSWRLTSMTRRTEDEWYLQLWNLFNQAGYSFDDINGVAISSVVPGLTTVFEALSTKHLDVDPLIIDSSIEFGMTVAIENPMSMGADRLSNIASGFFTYGGPLIIVDFGTATTFDVVTAEGAFIGGAIAPGLETAARYLHQLAAKLPSVELKFPDKVITTTTEGNMQVGIMYGTAAAVDGIVSKIWDELGGKCRVLATGGIGRLVVDRIECIDEYDPELTMKGIEIIYSKVRRK